MASVASLRNLVVSGPYGIGKTSLTLQMAQALSGNQTAITKHNLRARLPEGHVAVARHKCQADNQIESIFAGLISSLRAEYSDAGVRKPIRETWRSVKRAGKGWLTKTLTIDPTHNSEASVGERASQNKFYRFVAEFLASEKMLSRVGLSKIDGIVFFIDETEVLASTVKVGSLVKAATEHFAENGLDRICFVVSGAEDTAARMYEQVGSARRVFDEVILPGMTNRELDTILREHLSGTDVTIDNPTADLIVRLANNSPARLHYLAWATYEKAGEHSMGREEFKAAALDILANIEKSDFRRVIELPTWPNYRMIMECIATREEQGATSEAISIHTGISVTSMGGYLKALMQENIICIRNEKDGDKNQYAFKEPVFGLYFKLANELGVHLPKAA